MIDLLIKYPTRQRPNEFKRILSSYINKLSGKYNVKFIISLYENDCTSNTDDIRNFLNEQDALGLSSEKWASLSDEQRIEKIK